MGDLEEREYLALLKGYNAHAEKQGHSTIYRGLGGLVRLWYRLPWALHHHHYADGDEAQPESGTNNGNADKAGGCGEEFPRGRLFIDE